MKVFISLLLSLILLIIPAYAVVDSGVVDSGIVDSGTVISQVIDSVPVVIPQETRETPTVRVAAEPVPDYTDALIFIMMLLSMLGGLFLSFLLMYKL